jgi:hypothetical protein
LYPVINRAILQARLAQMSSNGRQIFLSIMMDAHSTSPMSDSVSFWPESDTYPTSTDYFRWMVTNDVIDATFEMFAGAGVPAYGGLDPEQFLPKYNAWAITADISDITRSSVPILVTRNAVLENGLLSDVPMVDPEMLPFGDKAIVVVRFGGSAQPIKRFELNEETFNAVAADNPLLYPEELTLE